MRVHLSDSSDVTRSRRFGYTSAGMLLSEYAPAQAGHASNQAVRVMHATGNAGALSRKLGAFAAGDTVEVTVWFKAPSGSSGAIAIHDGRPGEAGDSKRFVSVVGTGGWQPMTLSLTLGRADTLWVHLYGDMYTSTSGTESSFVDYDDLLVKKNGANWMQDGFESGLNVGSDPQSTTGYYACAAGLASLRTTDGSPDQWKRDVVYVGGRAIAEVDAEGIHELHTDHLGTPRIITAGSNGMTEAGQPVALGHVEGRQAFAPYGEFIRDIAWTKGYSPLTGYTGHVQQTSTNADNTVQPDPTGLIYMRGRYYSPAWHRFLNSDQGVDPMQFNQFAYVAGSPLQATDPSGMRMTVFWQRVCAVEVMNECQEWKWVPRYVWTPDPPGGGSLGSSPINTTSIPLALPPSPKLFSTKACHSTVPNIPLSGSDSGVRMPDMVSLNIGVDVIASVSLVGSVDRYGQKSLGFGIGGGYSLSIVSAAIYGSWIHTNNPIPTRQETRNFVDGGSVNISGGFVLGGGKTVTLDGQHSTDLGIFSPQISISGQVGKCENEK